LIGKKTYIHTILLWIVAFVIPNLMFIYIHQKVYTGILLANIPIVIFMHFLGNELLNASSATKPKECITLIILWLPPAILFYFTMFLKDAFAIMVNYILGIPYILLMFFILKYFKEQGIR